MKAMLYFITCFYVLLCIIISCSKTGYIQQEVIHIIDDNDSINPVITIYQPIPNQVFYNNDSIKIVGKVTDQGLYRGSIKIMNDITGIIAKEQSFEIHGLRAYAFNIPFKTTVLSTTDFTVLVEFVDHGLNITSETIKIRVNP